MPSALATWMALAALYAPDLTTTCTIDALPGLSAQLRRVSRATGVDPRTATPATTSPPQAGRIAEFWQLAESVGLPSAAEADCDASVRARDDVAWSMGLVGYSAREIADVLNGHLSRADLDEALSRTMAGEPKSLVAAFLESRWREPVTAATTSASPAQRSTNSLLPDQLETALIALASEHRIQPALVRAVIAVESGGNARAVSPAGAIGLMQLMPRTAAALGVNPWQPLENLRGGIAYLAGLLRAYGDDIRLALIAYNAGPSHADLVRSGRAVAYRETRKYLEAILAKYPVP